MNLKFTPTALSLTLAANAVVLGSGSLAQTTKNVAASYHHSETNAFNADQSSDLNSIDATAIQTKPQRIQENEPDVGLLSSSLSTIHTGRFSPGRSDAFFPFRRHDNTNYHITNRNSNDEYYDNLRFLQGRNGTSNCPDTCDPDLCSCVEEHGEGYSCAAELHAVCTNSTSTINDCVKPSYLPYYTQIYCPFAACIVNGGTYESCSCEFYNDFCDVYGEDEIYSSDPKTIAYCAIATCCAAQTEDAGRGACLGVAPTATPSGMPSEPTVSPAPSTNMPTMMEDNDDTSKPAAPQPKPTPGTPDTPTAPSPADDTSRATFAPTKPPSADEEETVDGVQGQPNSANRSWNKVRPLSVIGFVSAAAMALFLVN